MELSDRGRKRFVLLLGVLIVMQAVLGIYFLVNGETNSATITFSTLAVLSGSMAALSANMRDE